MSKFYIFKCQNFFDSWMSNLTRLNHLFFKQISFVETQILKKIFESKVDYCLVTSEHCVCLGLREVEEKGFKFHSFKLPFCWVCQVNNDWHPEVFKAHNTIFMIFAVSTLTEEKWKFEYRGQLLQRLLFFKKAPLKRLNFR